MYRRNIAPRMVEALEDTPVVTLVGARQTGKTTLVRQLAQRHPDALYTTLDDATTLAAAMTDPTAFARRNGTGLLVVDEIQKAPELLPAMKVEIDRNRSPGRYLLTGSAHVLTLPRVSESLAGRMEVLRLRPLSQCELEGVEPTFVDGAFSRELSPATVLPEKTDLADRVLRGGFPEVVARRATKRRDAWFGAYLTSILQRDIRDLARVEGLTRMPSLLSLLAARSAALVNKAELSRAAALPYTTLDRYLALFEATFLYEPIPAWATNLSKRLVRSAKVALVDSGLAAHLVGANTDRWQRENGARGALVESFVAGEIRAQIDGTGGAIRLFHFRSGRQEVDLVLEDRAGRVVGVEVKAGATVASSDFRGLRALSDAAGNRFVRGILLYDGTESIPFGSELFALPIAALWNPAR